MRDEAETIEKKPGGWRRALLLWGIAVACGGAVGWAFFRQDAPATDVVAGSRELPLVPQSEEILRRRPTKEQPYEMMCFESKLPRPDVAEHLREELRARGWQEDPAFTKVVAESTGRVILSFNRGNDRLIAGLEDTEEGGTRVTNLSWPRNRESEEAP